MPEAAGHQVGEQRISEALDDIRGRAFGRWHSMRYDGVSLPGLRRLRDELLDHVAARTLNDPGTLADETRLALRSAAGCACGVESLTVWPKGDFEVALPLIDETLSGSDPFFGDPPPLAPGVGIWVEAFALSLIASGLREPFRIGLVLKKDDAPELRAKEPAPARHAELDALCAYLAGTADPTVRKPSTAELDHAARRLDEAGPLSPDQRLLRALLTDDRPTFERALTDRLVEHRESIGEDPRPSTLLPLTPLALAALAVQVHDWHLDIHSPYLPKALLET